MMSADSWQHPWDQPCVPIPLEKSPSSDNDLQTKYRNALEQLQIEDEDDDFTKRIAYEKLKDDLLKNQYHEDDQRAPVSQLDAEQAQSMSRFMDKFMKVLSNKTAAKELYELEVKQAKETTMRHSAYDAELANLMEIQADEMMAVSLDGTSEEIAALVETHMATRANLEKELLSSRMELLAEQIANYRAVADRLSTMATTSSFMSDSRTTLPLPQSHESWRDLVSVTQIQQLKDLAGSGTLNKNSTIRDALSAAKSLGKTVVGPWIGLLPESLSLVSSAEVSGGTSGVWGQQLPVSASTFIHVQMGSSLKTPFRVLALIPMFASFNIHEIGRFDIWHAHAQTIYTSSEITAFILPLIGTAGDDMFSLATKQSPELHFAGNGFAEFSKHTGTTIHSNLLGAHLIIRANGIIEAIKQADELKVVGKVAIPIKGWGAGISETILMRKVKEALVYCSSRRYISGGCMCEVAFLYGGPNLDSSKEKDDWLKKMKALMVEVFD